MQNDKLNGPWGRVGVALRAPWSLHGALASSVTVSTLVSKCPAPHPEEQCVQADVHM